MILSGLGLNFSYIFESFFCDFEWFWAPILEHLALWRVSGPSLGYLGVPWATRVPPTWVQVAKSWFVGPPLASQDEVIVAYFFDVFLIKNALIFD